MIDIFFLLWYNIDTENKRGNNYEKLFKLFI